MTLYEYHCVYRRTATAMGPEHQLTVVAESADDARRVAAETDPAFGSTVRSPRRGRAVDCGECYWHPGTCSTHDVPESADPITSAKARADLERGVAHFATWQGCEVEVV